MTRFVFTHTSGPFCRFLAVGLLRSWGPDTRVPLRMLGNSFVCWQGLSDSTADKPPGDRLLE